MGAGDVGALRPGHPYRLTRAASPQFGAPIVVRVIRVLRDLTEAAAPGWAWVDVYQLNGSGDAVERRALYFQPAAAQVVGDDEFTPRPEPAGRRGVRRRVDA
jgi:hypothetical protein